MTVPPRMPDGQPMPPPWAFQFGLHPPGQGTYEDYLDPASPVFRADVAAALARQDAEARARARESEIRWQKKAARVRERMKVAETTTEPVALALAVADLRGDCEVGLAWRAWEGLKASGAHPPTHDLVLVRVRRPRFGPRFTELDRRPAWFDRAGRRFLDEANRVYVQAGGQPLGDRDAWFDVEPGVPIRATVASTDGAGRATWINSNTHTLDEDEHPLSAVHGVLLSFRRSKQGKAAVQRAISRGDLPR